jgi:methionine-rich copper-binding protein CopC
MTIGRFSAATVLALALGLSATLGAHMKFDKAEPAPDSSVAAPLKTIQIWFSEAPDLKVSKLDLAGPSGPVKVTGLHAMGKSLMATVEGTAPAGAYKISWQAAGDDGHVQKGEYAFTVKAAQ